MKAIEQQESQQFIVKSIHGFSIKRKVETDIGGHTLDEMPGFSKGPTGIIESVKQVGKQTAESTTKKVYEVQIADQTIQLREHPRVYADGVDPLACEDMNVATDEAGGHNHQDTTAAEEHDDSRK